MLQDIGKGVYRNEYDPAAVPSPEDAAVYEKGNAVFLREDGEEIAFPSVGEAEGEREWRYLFRLGERRFFLSLNGEVPEGLTKRDRRSLRRAQPKKTAFAAIAACQLGEWYSHNRFCGNCGAEMIHDGKERMVRCPECGNMVYPKICPAVITAVTRGDSILLTRYAGRGPGNWALVAGFNEIGETIEDTARREVMEETGLRVGKLRYYKSQPWCLTDTLLFGFWCEAEEGEIRVDENELALAQWVKRDEIDVAFDDISLTNEMITRFREGREYEKTEY